MEAIKYPFMGAQWHSEVPFSVDAIQSVNTKIYGAFVKYAKKSCKVVDDSALKFIDSYDVVNLPTITGRARDTYVFRT